MLGHGHLEFLLEGVVTRPGRLIGVSHSRFLLLARQPAGLPADRIESARSGRVRGPGTVFGVGASSLMPDIARRYARGLALHHRDHILPDERHMLAQEDAQ